MLDPVIPGKIQGHQSKDVFSLKSREDKILGTTVGNLIHLLKFNPVLASFALIFLFIDRGAILDIGLHELPTTFFLIYQRTFHTKFDSKWLGGFRG